MSISRKHNHGTNVYCCEMNRAIVMMNVDLLYYAVMVKEAEQLEDLDIKSRISCRHKKNMSYFQDGIFSASACAFKMRSWKNLSRKL